MQGVADTFKEEIEGLTRKQANAIFQIFREAETNNINKFLSDIKENAKKVKGQGNDYKGKLEKILKHVFIGKEKLEQLKQTISSLPSIIEAAKGKLKEITEDMIQALKEKLKRLEESMSAE
ncbi:hypothetical protein [Candidatus Mycoplasma haematohominis]|uniref:hypothetical protein n=1 Tax=Candidatus Mycoplasma haematohominis TaxID=1494318 RepID=UPI001C0A7454|nr:hypothetical protein [Candidatus Mycoplasma haemohominis]